MADTITSWDDLKTIGSKNNWDNAENVYNLIKGTLTGRTAGTPITPASHENMALAVIYNTYMKKAVIDGDMNVPGTVTATGFKLNGGTSDLSDKLLTGNGLYTSLSSIMTAIANKSDYTAPTLWGHKLTSGETNYEGDLTSATGYISAAGFKVAGQGSNVLLADGNTITQSSLKGTDGKDGITSASIWGNAISTTGTTTVDYNDTAYIDNIESTAKSLILNTGTYPVTIGAGAALVGIGANMFNIGNNYKIGTVGNSVLIGNSYITGTVTALNDITASKFITKDGTSSQLVCGDGSLIAKTAVGDTTGDKNAFVDATIWGQNLASGGTVKGDLSYVTNICFGDKNNTNTVRISSSNNNLTINNNLGVDGDFVASDIFCDSHLYTSDTLTISGNSYIADNTYVGGTLYFGAEANRNNYNTYLTRNNLYVDGNISTKGNAYFTYSDGTTAYTYYISPDKNGLSTNGNLCVDNDIYAALGDIYTESGSITAGNGDLVSVRGNIYTTGDDTCYIGSNTAYIHKAAYFGDSGNSNIHYLNRISDNTGIRTNGDFKADGNIYANKFITDASASDKLVCGDGSLIDKSSIGGSGSGGSSFSPATIWGETLASGGTVKGDLSYVGDIYFDNKYNDTTYYIKETTGVINTNGSLSIDGNLYLSDVNSSGNAYIDGITYHTAPVYFGDSGNSNIHYLNRISDNTGIRTNGDFKADGNIYANKFITDASASDKLVCGDGSLIAKTAVGDTTGDKNAFVDATIWGQNLTSGGTVKGDLAYVDNIYFGDKTSTDITYFTTGTHAVVLKGNFSTSGDIIVGLDTDDAGKSINSGALFAYEIYADGILHTSNKLTVKGNSYIEDTAYFTGNTAYFNNSYINNTAYFKNNTSWQASSYITTNDVGGIFAYSSLYTPELHASKSLIEASYTDDIYNIVPSSTYLAVHNGIYAAGNIFTEGKNSYIATQTTYTGNAYFTYNDGTTAYKYYISPDKNGLSTNGNLCVDNDIYAALGDIYTESGSITAGNGDLVSVRGNIYTTGDDTCYIGSNTAYIHKVAYFGDNTYYITQNSKGLSINEKHILTETDINGWESEIVVTNQSTGLTSETLGTDVNNNMDGVKITYTRNKYGICNIMFNINLSTKFPSFITEGNAVTSEATLIKTACIKNIPGNSTFGGDFIGNSYDFNITGYAIESDINSSENITPVMCEVKFHNDALWISIIKPYASWTIGNTSDKLLFSGSLMIKK